MMSTAKRLILTIVWVSSFLALVPNRASACTCAINPSPRDEFDISTAVFTGRVVSTDLLLGLGTSSPHPVRVTLEVDEVWKGPASNRLTVYTAVDGGGCGFDFNVGWRYLVYARGDENFLQVNSCTRTTMLSYAGDDLAALGEGIQIRGRSLSSPVLIIISIGLGMGIIAVMEIRRRRIHQVCNP